MMTLTVNAKIVTMMLCLESMSCLQTVLKTVYYEVLVLMMMMMMY